MIRCPDRMPRMTSMKVAPRDIIASAGWIILGLCGCYFGLGPLCVEAMRPARGRVNHFYQDWASARNYRVGLPIYTRHSASIRDTSGSRPTPSKTSIHANSPTSVLLISPFGRLAYPDAVFTWSLISLAAFFASLVILAAACPCPGPSSCRYWPCCLLPSFVREPLRGPAHPGPGFPGHFDLGTGAIGPAGAAGLLLGLAAAIKLFPAYLAVYFAARRRWRPCWPPRRPPPR